MIHGELVAIRASCERAEERASETPAVSDPVQTAKDKALTDTRPGKRGRR